MSRAFRRNGGTTGFTMVELLVVMVILAILVAIAVPMLLIGLKRARISGAIANVREIQLAFERYYIDNDRYPYVDDFNRATLEPLVPIYIPNSEQIMKRFDGEVIHTYTGPTPDDKSTFTWSVFLPYSGPDSDDERFRITVEFGEIKLIHRGEELTVEQALRRAEELL